MGDTTNVDVGTTGPSAGSQGAPARELAVIVNVVTAYQRILIRLDADTLTIDTPTTWLGIVPHGRRVIDVARTQIRDACIAPAVFPTRLVVAIGLAAAVALASPPALLAVAGSVVALLFLLLSVVASIRIDTLTGDRHVVPVCWFERRAVQSLLADLEESAP